MNWYKQAYGERNFKPTEFLKELRNYGVIVEREGSGSIKMLYNTFNGERTSLHFHKSKTLSSGAVKKMLLDLGINPNYFMKRNIKEYINEMNSIDDETIDDKKENIPAWKNQPWFLEKQKYVQPEKQHELV